ncbi:hypothetical protein LBMAG21_02160 [Armatimonadota bacterium]|nr:hypothetical protein LBMAG21_02160 [Armatimonadota bacterium]
MNLEDVRTLYLYNDWANDRLVQMLYTVFGEEADLRATGDAQTLAIQEAAVHIIGSQWMWRSRCLGISPTERMGASEYPTPLAIRFAFGAERARFWGYFDTMTSDDDLNRIVAFKTTEGVPYEMPLYQILQHVITHGGYHRGQITGRLLDRGDEKAILSTDLIGFYRELQERP